MSRSGPPDCNLTPSLCGYWPLNMLALLGQHDGIDARKFEYVTPEASHPTVLGKACHMSARASSRLITRRFGRSAADAAGTGIRAAPAIRRKTVDARTMPVRRRVVLRRRAKTVV